MEAGVKTIYRKRILTSRSEGIIDDPINFIIWIGLGLAGLEFERPRIRPFAPEKQIWPLNLFEVEGGGDSDQS
jgi:hypothetical protein